MSRYPTKTIESLEARVMLSAAYESLDGTGNNLANPTWGAAGIDLLRLSPQAYADGISSPAGASRPSARAVSNNLNAQATEATNNRNMSDFVYLFGQFLDHDLDLTTDSASDTMNIAIPAGDASFDPTSTGTQTMAFNRSQYDAATGTSVSNPRQQINQITSFIDGSQIYGSDAGRAAALRTFSGGQLKTSDGNLLPFNTDGLPNANDAHVLPDTQLFLAGDIRANENIEETAVQTLFMREHNRIADSLAAAHPRWSDEQLYQEARRRVIGELQAITYNEFLPALLGSNALRPYHGYNPKVNPSISTEFSTAAFRFGHSLLDGDISRLNNDGTTIPEGSVALRDAFFNPTLLNPSLPNHEGDIDPILKGAATGDSEENDLKVVDDVRNFLFGPPGAGGFDLVALDIQRGRDHGLSDYNTMRVAFGLPAVTDFSQISSDPATQTALKNTYGSVNNIDAFEGGMAEDHAAGASVGPLFERIIADQFERLRDGDRFWYQRQFSGPLRRQIQNTTLSDVIRRNTSITNIQKNVFFYVPPAGSTEGGEANGGLPPSGPGSDDGNVPPVQAPIGVKPVATSPSGDDAPTPPPPRSGGLNPAPHRPGLPPPLPGGANMTDGGIFSTLPIQSGVDRGDDDASPNKRQGPRRPPLAPPPPPGSGMMNSGGAMGSAPGTDPS